jgi:hypothetical protein
VPGRERFCDQTDRGRATYPLQTNDPETNWGLPLGPTPRQPDPVSFGDSVTSGIEAVLVAACVALLVRGRGRTSDPRGCLRSPVPRSL